MTNLYKIPAGYIFDGEPRMVMTEGGVDWEVRGGQPVMGSGLENWALISEFTESEPEWWGNHVIGNEYRIKDSNFDKLMSGSITRSTLIEAQKEAERALDLMVSKRVASRVEAEITINEVGAVVVAIAVYGPSSTLAQLLLQKYGINWVAQSTDPAHERLTDEYR